MSLTDNVGWIMAVGNDVGYDQIFVQQLMNYGRPGDLLHRHQRLGQQPQRAGRRRLGQSPRPEDLRPDRLRRRQAPQMAHSPASTCRWTTWAWSRASTCACSTGCSTTFTPGSTGKGDMGRHRDQGQGSTDQLRRAQAPGPRILLNSLPRNPFQLILSPLASFYLLFTFRRHRRDTGNPAGR